ncbi:MAG: ComF family protein [Candidatus Levybacteria bacterium]|nr:ComF family protein [Candidatus Levybacteria bacterium]MBI2420626.1 ComF family protein [Candidatus Levybacteria bacterium]
MGILDFIFPKYCVNCKKLGDYICSNCFSRLSFDTEDICPECSKPAISGITHPKCRKKYSLEGTFTALVFNPTLKKIIYQFKYSPHLSDLRGVLIDLAYESLIQNQEFQRVLRSEMKKLIFIPIPLHPSKFRKRGYNQSEILAKELGKKFDIRTFNVLKRIKYTKSQVGLIKEKRRENIRNAFAFDNKFKKHIARKSIFLIDDVLTTGSTTSEAGKVLKKAGAGKVWAVTLAKEK